MIFKIFQYNQCLVLLQNFVVNFYENKFKKELYKKLLKINTNT